MEFYGYHGLFKEEKKLGQRFIVDVELNTSLRTAGISDKMKDSIDYGQVFLTVKEIVEGKPKNLIEAVAEKIAASLLEKFSSLTSCSVKVIKPDPPIQGHYESVAVQIYRDRQGARKMNTAYIGLGSNIEPREKYLEDSIKLLIENDQIEVTKISSIYETPPTGFTDQDHFLNMAIEIKTSLDNTDLLTCCQDIEKKLGRKKTIKNGPRTIDLDILFYNSEYRHLEKLQIPHPRIQERAFVLVPLCEIAPKLVMPTSGMMVEEMLHDLPQKNVDEVVLWKKSFNE